MKRFRWQAPLLAATMAGCSATHPAMAPVGPPRPAENGTPAAVPARVADQDAAVTRPSQVQVAQPAAAGDAAEAGQATPPTQEELDKTLPKGLTLAQLQERLKQVPAEQIDTGQETGEEASAPQGDRQIQRGGRGFGGGGRGFGRGWGGGRGWGRGWGHGRGWGRGWWGGGYWGGWGPSWYGDFYGSYFYPFVAGGITYYYPYSEVDGLYQPVTTTPFLYRYGRYVPANII